MSVMNETGRALSALGLVALLSSCGGGSDAPPDPLRTYKQQTLAWEACDSTILGQESEDLKELGDRARCANMRVPLDYADPSKGEASVALLRVSARKPQERRGAIFFNPGGPGGDGLGLAAEYGKLWSKDDLIPARDLLNQLSDRYDLVGFSPRGTGASTNLYCRSNELKKKVTYPSDRSPENIAAMLHNAKLTASACKKNPLTKYINTDQTARDMDLTRELLGDKKLSYIGYSYGTWLGAWYASLFPDHVDRMLIDSNMNVAGTFDDAMLTQPMSFQRILDEVLAPFAARHDAVLGLGATADAVKQVVPDLPPMLRSVLAEDLIGSFYSSKDVKESLLMLTAAKGVGALLASTGPEDLQNAITTYAFAPDGDADEGARGKARALANAYVGKLNETPRSVELSPADDGAPTYRAVACNDTPTRLDEQFWIDTGNEHVRLYPLMGGDITEQPCLYWGGPSAVKPALAGATRVPGILMVQSEFDGATATEGAKKSLEALPNARMILIKGEYSHAIFPYNTACVDERVARYFLTGELPGDRETVCDGKPLVLDERDARTALALKNGQPATRASGQAISSEENIRKIHDIVRSANKRR